MTDAVELFVLGDICPVEGVRELFDNGNCSELFGGLAGRFRQADVVLANLECVLSESACGIEKVGPVLVGKPSDAKVLASAGISLVGVANNHIGDCGSEGVRNTLAACRAAGIRTVGAGEDAEEAARPIILQVKGLAIGVLAFAEHEFNAAGSCKPGAHIFDPLRDLERINELKGQCDFLVVLYHGGIEHYPLPSPGLRETCRSMVRHGADLVLCQHSHVIGAAEEYEGGNILYGQGNALYGHRIGNPDWNRGLAVSVVFSGIDAGPGGQVRRRLEYLPIGCDSSGRVDFLADEEARRCISEFEGRSMQCLDDESLARSWCVFVDRLGKTHLPHVLGLGRVATKLNRLTGGLLLKLFYSRRQRLVAMNVIRCAAHREVLETAFARSVSHE